MPVRGTARLWPVVRSEVPCSFHFRALLPWALQKHSYQHFPFVNFMYLNLSQLLITMDKVGINHWLAHQIHIALTRRMPRGYPHYPSCIGENTKPPV